MYKEAVYSAVDEGVGFSGMKLHHIQQAERFKSSLHTRLLAMMCTYTRKLASAQKRKCGMQIHTQHTGGISKNLHWHCTHLHTPQNANMVCCEIQYAKHILYFNSSDC